MRILNESTTPHWRRALLPTSVHPLSDEEVAERTKRFGPNILVPEKRDRGLMWTVRFFTDPMVVLLLLAAGTYLTLGDRFDATIALAAIFPIFFIAATLERRCECALDELRAMALPTARVRRGLRDLIIDAREVVPGDVMLVQAGDVFVADGMLMSGSLVVDESALTADAQPVVVEPGGAFYAGTVVRSGRGETVVSAIGTATRYGRAGRLTSEMHISATPLELVLRKLVWRIGLAVIVFCAAVILVEHGRGALWPAALIAGVSLAMAGIPEELPMVYTLSLALGAWKMRKGNVLVRRLASVETLGCVNAICVHKTGTLTYGTLELTATWVDPKADEDALLRAAALACEAKPFDPLDQAVLRFVQSRGLSTSAQELQTPQRRYPFDVAHRRLTQVWSDPGGVRIASKGAMETIVSLCTTSDEQRRQILAAHERFARDGMRVIAVAQAIRATTERSRAADESNLQFMGLLAFEDAIREDVPAAIEACVRAGIRVIMITGDHPDTAAATARRLGLPSTRTITGADVDGMYDSELIAAFEETPIFSRIAAEQKLRIVKALHARGAVVAVTGDGTSDVLALREADIGVAMGQRGTAVARAAADIVLVDDGFATLVGAIARGRNILRNLRRAFRYLTAYHAPLVACALAIPLVGLPLFLLPIHLVWLELIVHPTAALVYEDDPADAHDLMKEPPLHRTRNPLRRKDWVRAILLGATLTLGTLAVYVFDLRHGATPEIARAMALATLMTGQLLLVITERSTRIPAWKQTFSKHVRLLPILAGTAVMLLAMLYVPPFAAAFRVAPLGFEQLAQAIGIAALCTLWLEPFKRDAPISAPYGSHRRDESLPR